MCILRPPLQPQIEVPAEPILFVEASVTNANNVHGYKYVA